MRLGQIARKLGVSQGEVVRYLSGQNLAVEEGSNVKLEEVHIRSLYAHFAPSEIFDSKQTVEEQSQASDAKISDAPIENADERALLNPPEEPANAPEQPSEPVVTTPSLTTTPNDQSETIRAPKIELAGLKVIGKIELPQPRKKETAPGENADGLQAPAAASTEGEGTASTTPGTESPGSRPENIRPLNRESRRPDDKRRSQNKHPREQRPYKNPIAAQREREIEEELQRRKEKAAQEKEKRTQNYQKRVKHSPPTKAARLIEEPLEQINETILNEQPTTWFGKFMKWFRS
ncbi:hypothetical protein WBG78_21575 [Chryseolinea sp. T2]|uniref:hypothetical protein n=1 Tax=Chryseolinea sp. T2 TaxID=3129255 RepID=UPI0030787BB4